MSFLSLTALAERPGPMAALLPCLLTLSLLCLILEGSIKWTEVRPLYDLLGAECWAGSKIWGGQMLNAPLVGWGGRLLIIS